MFGCNQLTITEEQKILSKLEVLKINKEFIMELYLTQSYRFAILFFRISWDEGTLLRAIFIVNVNIELVV